ncbi:MAG: hypothetical protein M0Z47_10765 [Actinomycetota bacterium]|nr:hypothetical protein [Actinomycetota bacterium]
MTGATVEGALIVNVVFRVDLSPWLSMTSRVIATVPLIVGVPEMSPDDVAESPVPPRPEIYHVYGGTPPDAWAW